MDYLTLLIDNQNYRLSKDLQSRPSRNLQSIGYQPSFCSNSSPVVVFNHRATFTLNPRGFSPVATVRTSLPHIPQPKTTTHQLLRLRHFRMLFGLQLKMISASRNAELRFCRAETPV